MDVVAVLLPESRLVLVHHHEAGFWEQNGYHIHGDPWKEERYW